MARHKNFGQEGVGPDVQFGKDGGRIRFDSAHQEFELREGEDSFYLPMRGGDPTHDQHFVTKSYFDLNTTPAMDVDVANPDGFVYVGPSKLRFNQGDGFYLSSDSSGDPIVNFDAGPEAGDDPLYRRTTLGTGATQDIGAILPLGAFVTRVKLTVTTKYDNNPEIVIGSDGSQIYMPSDENDPKDKKKEIFISETRPDQAAIDGTRQLQATITNAPTVGAAAVLVEYLIS